jgi:hypothetical protein
MALDIRRAIESSKTPQGFGRQQFVFSSNDHQEGGHQTMLKGGAQLDQEDDEDEPIFLRDTFATGPSHTTVY